jgi:Skp family chaperone for outer membrane proteins
MKALSLFIFIIIFSLAIFSQTAKTAKVDFDAFEDEKNGIKELVDVLQKLDEEFKPKSDELKLLNDKIVKSIKDIQSKYSYPENCFINNPLEKLEQDINLIEKLQTEFKEKQENAILLYKNRRNELTESINKQIRIKLAEFSKLKGFAFIFDSSDANSFLNNQGDIDTTKEFIEFCNIEFEKEKTQNLK